jgi:hypothetical protein
MLPNTCKCNWIPMVFGLTEPVWGLVTHYKVVCENCGRRGKYKSTREEAIEEWNTNGPDKTGIMK